MGKLTDILRNGEIISTALADLKKGIGEVAEVKAGPVTLTVQLAQNSGATRASITKLQGDVDQMMKAIGDLKAEAARQAAQVEDADWKRVEHASRHSS